MFADSFPMPEVMTLCYDTFNDMGSSFFEPLAFSVGGVLAFAAVVYVTFIGWRAFKAATNKV